MLLHVSYHKCVLFSTLKKSHLTSWSSKWDGESIPVEWHSHFSPDSDILSHFPWYRRPFSPLAWTLWPPDPTRKTLCHPPPSLLAALYPPLSPPSIRLGSAADGWALRRGLQEGSGLLSGTFQRCCAGIERDELRQDWHRFERGDKWREDVLRAKEVWKNVLRIVSLCKQFLPRVAATASTPSFYLSPDDLHILIFHHLHHP